MAWLRLFFVFIVLSTIPASTSASIGKVLSVKQGADVTRAGKTIRLREGMEVESGDAIATNGSGVVQLVFVDETKIAVGPNARMVLDVSMLRGNRKAKNFTVRALGGSFRFISGKSRKRAYSIKTPTATMAVRGTTFDMWITSQNQSAMLVIEGTVQMCGRRGSCRSASRQCSMFATAPGGQVGRAADQQQYDKALKGGFPFIQSQKDLLPQFQVSAEGCAGDVAVAPRRSAEPRPESPQRAEVRSDPPARERRAPERSEPARASASANAQGSTRSEIGSDGGVSVSASPTGGGSGAQATATAGGVTATAGW